MTTELKKRQATSPDVFTDPAAFEHMQRVAKMFANSSLIPQEMRGKIADVAVAMTLAYQLHEHPLILMQNITFVNGRAGFLTAYMIARANRSGRLDGPIWWTTDGSGEDLSVTAHAKLASSHREVTATADMTMARGEGWTRNKKYQSMPEHMLSWRSAAMLIRRYLPDVMLGYATADELQDVALASGDLTVVAPQLVPVKTLADLGEIGDDVRAPVASETTDAATTSTTTEDPPVPDSGLPFEGDGVPS